MKNYFWIVLISTVLLVSSLSFAVNSFSFTYKSGWNLISPPVGVPASFFDGICQVDGPILTFENGTAWRIIKKDETMFGGKGYFIKVKSDCGTSWGFAGSYPYEVRLVEGWNMIGAPFNKEYDLVGLANRCDINVLWKYDPATQKYIQTTKLKPGSGYWAYSSGNCTFGSLTQIFSLSKDWRAYHKEFIISLPIGPSSELAVIFFNYLTWDIGTGDYTEKFAGGGNLNKGECKLFRVNSTAREAFISVKLDDIRRETFNNKLQNVLDLTVSEDVPCALL